MWNTRLPILLAASLAASLTAAAPASADPDFNQIITGIAQSLFNQEADRNAFAEAQHQNTAAAYRNYLTKFPHGAYRANAQAALAKLGVPPVPPLPGSNDPSAAAVEASIGLSRAQRVLIQKQLTAVGYSTGFADGLWGAKTRSAIVRWQTANKLAATGYVTRQEVNLIAQQAGPGVGTDPTGPVAGDAQLEEQLLGLTYAERREVQSRLTTLGYRTYGIDGVFGGNTRRALAQWQRDEVLPVTGYLTADELRSLRVQTGG